MVAHYRGCCRGTPRAAAILMVATQAYPATHDRCQNPPRGLHCFHRCHRSTDATLSARILRLTAATCWGDSVRCLRLRLIGAMSEGRPQAWPIPGNAREAWPQDAVARLDKAALSLAAHPRPPTDQTLCELAPARAEPPQRQPLRHWQWSSRYNKTTRSADQNDIAAIEIISQIVRERLSQNLFKLQFSAGFLA